MPTCRRGSYLPVLCLVLLLVLPTFSASEGRPADAVYVRVVDVGAGLCTVTSVPGGHYMIYDAGDYQDQGKSCIKAIREIIPERAPIDLLVLSHTDGDHVAAVPAICREHQVRAALRPGISRESKVWKAADAALRQEARDEGMADVRLTDAEAQVGGEYHLGDATVTVVEGYGTPPQSWGLTDDSERRNAGSIVVRLTYHGHAVLFAGDSVGRHLGDAPDACRAAEAQMVARAATVPLGSNVLIAPHHGADNGSANCFIAAVKPDYVVFSAGHKFQHPRTVTAERYLAHGVEPDHIFRTDLGDDEGGAEWAYGRVTGTVHRRGEKDVEITLPSTGNVTVRYRSP